MSTTNDHKGTGASRAVANNGKERQDDSDAVWQQAAKLRDVLRDETIRTERRRAEAEAARRAVEEEVLQSTRRVCEQMRAKATDELRAAGRARSEAESSLMEAKAEAERLVIEASEEARRLVAEAETRLKQAREVQRQAQAKSETAVVEAQRNANEIRDRMRDEAAEEIRGMLADIEGLRTAAQRELETQRIVTETTRIRAAAPPIDSLSEFETLNPEKDIFSFPSSPVVQFETGIQAAVDNVLAAENAQEGAAREEAQETTQPRTRRRQQAQKEN
jgi:hypothetical protein